MLILIGGARRNRTDDLFNAIEALSQLSYGPINSAPPLGGRLRAKRFCRRLYSSGSQASQPRAGKGAMDIPFKEDVIATKIEIGSVALSNSETTWLVQLNSLFIVSRNFATEMGLEI